MKLLVVSDTHGHGAVLREAPRRHRDADMIIHTGDGAPDFLLSPEPDGIPKVAVRGNCDFFSGKIPDEEALTLEGVRILITHGHKYNVKFSAARLAAEARRRGFDLVIFGHTHEKCEKYIPAEGDLPPLYLFNPGAAITGDYGLIDIRDGQILMSHGSIFD